MDCVHELISTIIEGVPAEKIIMSIGIANRLCKFCYSEMPFCIVDGRGFGDPLQLLSALGIPYECISEKDIFDYSECKNLMFFCAKDLLMGLNGITPCVKQLLFFYTGFFVKSIEQNKITFGICRDDNNYCITKAELEKLRKITTYPMNYSCQFVRIINSDYSIKKELQESLLAKSIDVFLDDKRTKSGTVSGRGMYDALTNVINEFSKAGDVHNANSKAEMFRHKMLTASLNVGTVGLYRREFSEAVRSLYDSGEAEPISDAFVRSAAIWRELGKRAMRQVNGNNAFLDKEYAEFAMNAIAEIKEIEINAMLKLQMVLAS